MTTENPHNETLSGLDLRSLCYSSFNSLSSALMRNREFTESLCDGFFGMKIVSMNDLQLSFGSNGYDYAVFMKGFLNEGKFEPRMNVKRTIQGGGSTTDVIIDLAEQHISYESNGNSGRNIKLEDTSEITFELQRFAERLNPQTSTT